MFFDQVSFILLDSSDYFENYQQFSMQTLQVKKIFMFNITDLPKL